MKALVIGPLISDYDSGYNSSVADALEQQGYQTRLSGFYVATPPGLLNRIRIDAGMILGYTRHYLAYIEDFNAHTLQTFREFRPDLVFVIRGSKVTSQTLAAMSGSVRVLWAQDTVARCQVGPEELREYDRRYVFEDSDVRWLSETHGLSAKFLPMGFDPRIYHPRLGVAKDIDVCFVGKYYPERTEILERLARDFPALRLCFYGRYVRYREPASWAQYLRRLATGKTGTFVNRSLNATEICALYARSKICLNMHHAQSSQGCNPRVFEIMGSKAFQLVDALPYLKGRLVDAPVMYANYDELRDAVGRYVHDEPGRQALADRGYAAALSGHTFAHRVREVLADCGLPLRSSPEPADA